MIMGNVIDRIISLSDLATVANNFNYEEEVVVFDLCTSEEEQLHFPLRFDALLIILVREGAGVIGIDLKEYEVKKNSLITIHPRNYISLTRFDLPLQTSVVACSHRIVEEVLPKLTDLLPLLIHHRTEPVSQLSERDAEGIDGFYRFLKSKLQGPHTPFLKQKVICMLQAALYEMMDIQQEHSKAAPSQRTRKEEIMARFILAVSENFRTNRQVSYYAEKLCITPKHLSSVVKEISNRTAGDWIDNYVIMEAKVLLRTTDKAIKEIATELSFANQSFFGKYFKHLTGLSPSEFRLEEL
jgi:AraC-like DNA-binding protein